MNVRNIELIEGKKPILLSAPHVYSHYRPSMRGVLKQGEPYTDYIVTQLSQLTDSNAIYINEPCTLYDPNYHQLESNLYKQEIKNIVKNKKIKYVFDVHGLSNLHHYDIGIMYCMRFRKSKELAYKLIDFLNKQKELRGISYYVGYNSKNLQETVTEYVGVKLKIKALQLEVAQYIRADKVLMESLIKGFSNFINSL